MNRSRLAIVMAADDTFALPLAAALHSILATAHPDTSLHLFIADDGIGARRRGRLERVLDRWTRPHDRVSWIDASERLASEERQGLKTSEFVSEAAYLRLLIPEILPDHYARAIYLDADLIVTEDLTPLWTHPMDDSAVLAVQDFRIHRLSHPEGVVRYRELGLDGDAPYFNSGVLVMNLDLWRRQEIAGHVFDYLHEYHEDINYFDQDGLNAVLADRWKPLDLRWNLQSEIENIPDLDDASFGKGSRRSAAALAQSPRIVHYTGSSRKPWYPVCDHPERDRFLHHLNASGWFTWWERPAWQALQAARVPEHYLREYSRPFRHRVRRAVAG